VVQYFQPMPKYLKIGAKEYIFDCQHGVSLAFVDESDVPSLLRAEGGCCGGKRKIVTLASQVVYSHWLDGQGGR
jgi:hypothetical protein